MPPSIRSALANGFSTCRPTPAPSDAPKPAPNPSGRPTPRQKKDAREAARERLDAEGKDGRFTRRKACPVLWARPSTCLLVGTTPASALARLLGLLKDPFGCGPTPADAGRRA